MTQAEKIPHSGKRRRGPHQWTQDEWQSIHEAIDALPESFVNEFDAYAHGAGRAEVSQPKFWRAFLLVARDTEISAPSILKLKISEVAPNGTIALRYTNPTRQVVVRLKRDTLEAIKAIGDQQKTLLTFPFGIGVFRKSWRQLLKLAELSAAEFWCSRPTMSDSDHHLMNKSIAVEDGNRTLRGFFESDYSPIKLNGCSPRTIALYKMTFDKFHRFLGREPMLTDLNDKSVSGLLQWLHANGRAVPTVNKSRANLVAVWNFACKRHLVADYPMLSKAPEPLRVPVAWMADDLQKLFRAASRAEGHFGRIPESDYWPALLHVLYDTGERIGAILGSEATSFDLGRGYLHVPAELRKGGRADKQFKLSEATVSAMRLLIGYGWNKPFTLPYGDQYYIYQRYRKVLRAAGLPTDSKSMFHRIRKTVASMYEANGGNATNLLGHSARKVTEAYLDPRLCEAKHACDVLPDPTSGKAVAQ